MPTSRRKHNAMETFNVKRNIFSGISKGLLNNIFAELDESSRIKNIITDRLDLGELQVDDKSAKVTTETTMKRISTSQANQVLNRCFSIVFIGNWGRGLPTFFRLSVMHVFCWVLLL